MPIWNSTEINTGIWQCRILTVSYFAVSRIRSNPPTCLRIKGCGSALEYKAFPPGYWSAKNCTRTLFYFNFSNLTISKPSESEKITEYPAAFTQHFKTKSLVKRHGRGSGRYYLTYYLSILTSYGMAEVLGTGCTYCNSCRYATAEILYLLHCLYLFYQLRHNREVPGSVL